MRSVLAFSGLLLAAAAPVHGEDPQCSAIRVNLDYERVATIEDVAVATERLAEVDAWYERCKSQFLADDREWIEIRRGTARQSLDWPRTLAQAVDGIIDEVDPEELAQVRASQRKDLIRYHMGWGMGIRNGLGLWRGNQALLRSACGDEACHPDDASMRIIEAVWERLQQQPEAQPR